MIPPNGEFQGVFSCFSMKIFQIDAQMASWIWALDS